MTHVTLHHKGQRKINVNLEGKAFHPGTTVRFPTEIAERLLRLYPDEVQDIKAATKMFEETEEAPVESENAAAESAETDAKPEDEKPARGGQRAKK